MDLDTFLTTLYVLIDDWYKSAMAEKMRQRPGPTPEMSDSEVLTVAIAGQWRGSVPWDSERGVVRYMQAHGRGWFPTMLSRSRFNTRVRNLWAVFISLQQALGEALREKTDIYEVVDCVPLPACSLAQAHQGRTHWLWWSTFGHGGNQGGWFFGEQLLLSVTATGVIRGWLVGPAQTDDRWLLQALLSQRAGLCQLVAPPVWRPWRTSYPPAHVGPLLACGNPVGKDYLADQGFNGIRWQTQWEQQYRVNVIAAPPAKAKRAWSGAWRYWLKQKRQIVETTFANLTTVFSLKQLQAHSRWGQYTRLAIACTAHNIGILLNRSLGRPDLAHATLIC